MATAIRVRVTWDETIVEDRLWWGKVRIGAGGRARASTPGPEDKYITLGFVGRALVLEVDAGAATRLEVPGEPAVELDGKSLVRTFLPPFGSGRLVIVHEGKETLVEFERVLVGDQSSDRVLWAWSAAALILALLSGGGYKLIRQFGDGDRPVFGRPPALTEREAHRVRVEVGPNGLGAARPQAGRGVALNGRSNAPLRQPATAPEAKLAKKTHPRAQRSRHPDGVATLVASITDGPIGRPPIDAVTRPVTQTTPQLQAARKQAIEDAQAALLAADLRKAIDSFSSASKESPLDYDQLNWLGLAHYLTGELSDAEETWQKAQGFDSSRADAVNNLASVAKRRGDTDGELALLRRALERSPNDCHATNSLALALAKKGQRAEAMKTLADSDGYCGGNYAYTSIQKAGILALGGDTEGAFKELESGLSRVDTMIPVKEFEVLTDLTLDPAFSSLKGTPRFDALVAKYLPRAAGWKDAPGLKASAPEGDNNPVEIE